MFNNIYDCFNNGEFMISVLLDFKKAFDTVDHDILLGKLHKLGIRGVERDWFRSYLYSREHVDVGGVCSSKDIGMGNCSVPQESVIGPLLFLVYINDMKQCSDKFSFIHYADDATVSLSGKNLVETINLANAELENIDKWLFSNKLALNIDKTNYVLFSPKNKN